MHKFLCCSLIFLAAQVSYAQTGTQPTPAPTVSTRSNLNGAGTAKTSTASYARPNLRPSSNPAPASPAKTARAVPASGKKIAPLKPVEQVKIHWLTIEEAMEKNKTEHRKIFIDVYTSWCGWCKHMDSTTFVNPAIAQYMNDHYYAVKFNAEQTQDVVFRGKTYRFKRDGARGYHELAAEWLNNRLSFPTAVFLDESLNTIQPLSGYLEAPKLEAILNYFGTDSHKTTPWETYERKFAANNGNGQ
jgi:thioredoxin-related protein